MRTNVDSFRQRSLANSFFFSPLTLKKLLSIFKKLKFKDSTLDWAEKSERAYEILFCCHINRQRSVFRHVRHWSKLPLVIIIVGETTVERLILRGEPCAPAIFPFLRGQYTELVLLTPDNLARDSASTHETPAWTSVRRPVTISDAHLITLTAYTMASFTDDIIGSLYSCVVLWVSQAGSNRNNENHGKC